MSSLDFVVIVVMLISILLSMLRGFTREVLTILAWVGAIFAVLYGLPLLRPIFRGFFQSPTTADIAAGALLGIVTLVVLSLISNQIGKAVKKSGLGPVDRGLGLLFGAARGVILLCLVYILLDSLLQPNLPIWLTEAKTQPFLAEGADKLKSLAPPEFAAALDRHEEKPEITIEKDTVTPLGTVHTEETAPATSSDQGYNTKERGNLDRLIENNTPQTDAPAKQ